MPLLKINAEDLLAGANTSFALVIPPEILKPGLEDHGDNNGVESEISIEIRPLTLGIFQLITKAAKENPQSIPSLMIKSACVEPQLTIQQINNMHIGLVEFLVENIRRISGLTGKKKRLKE